MDDIETGSFWQFSLDFYAVPEVAAALLRLQDAAGANVNLVLYGLWLGHSGRGRLTPDGLAVATAAVAPIEDGVVAPLRRLRRDLKHAAAADIQALRGRVKAVELAAEEAAQARLAALAGPPHRSSAAARAAAAAANLALCLGNDPAVAAAALVLRRALRC